MKLNMDYLVERLWEELKLIRVYTKKPGGGTFTMCHVPGDVSDASSSGQPPDFDDGIIFRSGINVKNVCNGIHR